MKDLLKDGDNIALLDDYLANVPCGMKWMHRVLDMKDRGNSTTKFTPVELICRRFLIRLCGPEFGW